MRRLFIGLGLAWACSSEGGSNEPEPVSLAGATGRGGAGLGGSAGASGGASAEGGAGQGGESSTEPTYAGSTSRGGAGGAGGSVSGGAGGVPGDAGAAGSAPVTAWLRECDPETCPQSFPNCMLMSVAEGAPSEKLCTFFCDVPSTGSPWLLDPAKVAACEELGGVCTGGGDVRAYCGPVI